MWITYPQVIHSISTVLYRFIHNMACRKKLPPTRRARLPAAGLRRPVVPSLRRTRGEASAGGRGAPPCRHDCLASVLPPPPVRTCPPIASCLPPCASRVKRGKHGESDASDVRGPPQTAAGAAVAHRAALCVSSPHGRARRSGRRLCATAAPGWTAETVPAFE